MRVIATLLSALMAFGVNAATDPSGAIPDISGTWQGTLQPPAPALRLVFRISRDSGAWKATMYSIDTTPDQTPVTAVSLDGSKLRLEVDSVRSSYQGTLSADGSSISGMWVLGTRSAPLDLQRASRATAWPLYDSGYKARFVTVDHGVSLEVLDWGGHGRPVILLAGLGNTAHVFDKFAPKLTGWYHVYGITRRGFGASSKPRTGYSAGLLGQDVLTVMDALKIERPVLIGHSIAGEELSYVGSHYPQKVDGLIYLDATFNYAFYDASKPFVTPPIQSGMPPVNAAILRGTEEFTTVSAPTLAICPDPHAPLTAPMTAASDESMVEEQISVIKRDDPTARIARIPNANHYVYISNEAAVLRYVHTFIDTLPRSATPE